ncbi:MAG: hypothetical protein ABIN48_03815 [Ginsengibacter sp.]
MKHMDFGDLLLTPVFIILFYYIFKRGRNKFENPILKKYHLQAFWVKMIGSIFFIIFYGIITGGDSMGLYHTEGKNLYRLILADFQNVEYLFKPGSEFDLHLVKEPYNAGYFGGEANFMLIRIDAIFSFITFGRYAPINLIFAAIGFSGLWKLFLFFYYQNPKLHKQFATCILFFPTVVFWSSGLLKDTLCIASLGWITYSLYEIMYHRRNILKNMVLLSFFTYLLVIIKVYIILAYLPFLILFIIFKNVKEVKSGFLKWLIAPALIILSIFVFSKAMSSFDNELGAYSIDEVTTSISTLNAGLSQKTGRADAASNFNLGTEYEESFFGLIKVAPYAVVATFFRPFIWEASKVTQMLAAIESLFLIFFTLFILFKTGPLRFIKIVLTNPLIMYCFMFAIVFGIFVGASTLNFGTLVRYKIPCLPFFAISLFLVYEKVKERAFQKSMGNAELSTTPNIDMVVSVT